MKILIADDHVGCADEGSNGAEPFCVIIAGIALVPIGCYGFRAAQPATTIGEDGAGVQEHGINEGLCHVYSRGCARTH